MERSLWALGLGFGLFVFPLASYGNLFANSRRRIATPNETLPVARLLYDGRPVCSAFFVRNTTGATLAVTARHCIGSNIEKWCADQGTIRSAATGVDSSCKRVVASSPNLDIILFELEHSIAPGTLRLSAFNPISGTRLKMLGYPSDPAIPSRTRPTVTENCWVASDQVVYPFAEWDPSVRHNCSTYGGNSGGPMLIEGSDVAVGLPFQYTPDDFQEHDGWSPNEWSALALVGNFVRVHRVDLAAAGVEIAETQGEAGPLGDYLAVGRCTSSEMPETPIYLTPRYLSSSSLAELQVLFEGQYQTTFTFECRSPSRCISESGQESFQIESPSAVTFFGRDGGSARFVCR